MTIKMGDVVMNLANGAETVRELWSCLYLQYYEKNGEQILDVGPILIF